MATDAKKKALDFPEGIALPFKAVRRGHETFSVLDAQGGWVATTGSMPYALLLAGAVNQVTRERGRMIELLKSAELWLRIAQGYMPSEAVDKRLPNGEALRTRPASVVVGELHEEIATFLSGLVVS